MSDSFLSGKNSNVRIQKSDNGFSINGIEKLSGGTSTSDYMTSADPAQKWMNFFCRSTATTGSSQVLYIRHNANGAGTSQQTTIRSYLTVTAALTAGTSAAVHATAEIGAGGSQTGLFTAGRFQIASTAATRTMSGTKAALYLEGNWGVGTTMGGEESFIAITDLTAVYTPYFIDMKTLTSDAAGAFYAGTHAGTTVSGVWRVRIPGGAVGYVKIYSD